MHHNPGSVTLIPILPKGRTLKCDHPAAKRYNNIYRAVWRPSSWNIPHPWQRSLLGLTFWLTPFQEVNKRLLVQLLQLRWQERDQSYYRKLEVLFIQRLLAVQEELGLEQNTNPVPTPTLTDSLTPSKIHEKPSGRHSNKEEITVNFKFQNWHLSLIKPWN